MWQSVHLSTKVWVEPRCWAVMRFVSSAIQNGGVNWKSCTCEIRCVIGFWLCKMFSLLKFVVKPKGNIMMIVPWMLYWNYWKGLVKLSGNDAPVFLNSFLTQIICNEQRYASPILFVHSGSHFLKHNTPLLPWRLVGCSLFHHSFFVMSTWWCATGIRADKENMIKAKKELKAYDTEILWD